MAQIGRLTRFTEGGAEDFRSYLRKRLQENTVGRCLGRARQFLRSAVKHRLIEQNPFYCIKGVTVQDNPKRMRYVTVEEAEKVFVACPDVEWQLIFALARFGGLRCPSAVLPLRWAT